MFDLVRNINKKCHDIGGYDILEMREIVEKYCEDQDIEVDTAQWDDLVNNLWCYLDVEIGVDFDNIDEFEIFLCENLV